tara:strand:+ start:741 stop:2282 length:1542 start_codon:yes stop_codon:yes gene_type:complete
LNKKLKLDTLILPFLGVLSSFSLPPFNYFFINFFTFSIFFVFLFKKLNAQSSKKIFFFYGWLFGFGYFVTNLYWITISLTFDQNVNFLIPIALILIPAFLSLFYGLFTLIFFLFNIKNIISSFFLFCLLFGLSEFVRGNILTGFPWNLAIYSFSENLSIILFTSVIGTYSLNLIIISLFSAPAIFFLRESKKEVIISISLLLMPIIFFSYGLFYKQKFLNTKIKDNPYLIRVIGANISLDRFYKDTKPDTVINELIDLSSPNQSTRTFFLWPEGIIPNTYQDELYIYKELFKKNFNENHLIGLGITSRLINENNYKYFNSFTVFDSNLNLIHNYNKVNLVPFGEFLPFDKYLNKIGLKTITNNFGSFSSGNGRKIFKLENDFQELKYLPLICYEIIYTGKLTKNFDFNFMINISEDGWFGKSIGPKQHFAHSIFRAIESGKYVIRSANNGMSAIINPLGEIESKIEYGKAGFIDFEKRRDLDPTLFSKYGNKLFVILILLYIFLIFSFNRFKK